LAVYEPTPEFSGDMVAAEVDTPTLVELRDGAALFRKAIAATKEDNRFGASVHVYDEAEYAGMRLFVAPDGKAGFALKGDDIVSVFGFPNRYRSVSRPLMELAVQLGGRRLDAFNTVLPEIYADHGFRTAARLPWNDEFAPEGWDKGVFGRYNRGEPDVVFMAYDPDQFEGADVAGIEYAEDYDDAVAKQQAMAGAGRIRKSSSGSLEQPRDDLGRFTAKTIEVAGVERPTTDSTGKPIHPTEEGIRNFWQWFGDSKVVDGRGRPVPQFHATAADFEAFKISRSDIGVHFGTVEQAADRGDARSRSFTLPVFLRVENPLRVNDMGNWKIGQLQKMLSKALPSRESEWRNLATPAQVREYLRGLGYDGLVYRNEFEAPRRKRPEDVAAADAADSEVRAAQEAVWEAARSAGLSESDVMLRVMLRARGQWNKPLGIGEDVAQRYADAENSAADLRARVYSNAEDTRADSYAVFTPEQVKSAIGNSGAFSPTDARITKSSSTEPPPRARPDKRFETGTANRITDEERELLLKSPVFSALPSRTHQELLQGALESLSRNPWKARELVEELATGMRTVIAEEDEVLLLAYKVLLQNRRLDVTRPLFDNRFGEARKAVASRLWDEVEADLTRVDIAVRTTGSIWGRWGNVRQRMLKQDFSLGALMDRAVRAKGMEPLTEDERNMVLQQARKIESMQAELDESEARAQELQDAALSADLINDIIERTARYLQGEVRAKSRPMLNYLRELAEESRRILNMPSKINRPGQRGQAGAVDVTKVFHLARIGVYELAQLSYDAGDKSRAIYHAWRSRMRQALGQRKFNYYEELMPSLYRQVKGDADAVRQAHVEAIQKAVESVDPSELTHRDVYEVVRAVVESGVHGEPAVMAETARLLQKVVPDITAREIRKLFSDYGRARFPSADAVKAELRELRAIAQLQESIDRLDEGERPLKSGTQRDKPTAEIRAKRRELNDRLKALEQASKNDPERLASYQDARATNLRNMIADLTKQRDTGERPVRTASPPLSPENVALREQVAALRKEIREIDAQRPEAVEAAAAKALQRRREQLERRIATTEARLAGEMPKLSDAAPRKTPAGDAETAAMELALKALQDQLAALERTQKARKSPEQRAIDARLRSLEQQERLIKEELLTGLRKERKEPATSVEIEAKLKALEGLKAQRDALRQSKLPPKPSTEEKYQQTLEKTLQRAIANVQGRIDREEFAPRVRVAREASKRNQELRLELKKVKHTLAVKMFEWEMAQRGPWGKTWGAIKEVFNISRSVMTSLDLSAMFRQVLFTFGHPAMAARAAAPMLRAAISATENSNIEDAIRARPNYGLYEKAGLHITESTGFDPQRVEEQFIGRWLERMEAKPGQRVRNFAKRVLVGVDSSRAPSLISGVRASGRAYATYTNVMRVEMFDHLLNTLTKSPKAPTEEEIKFIAALVNVGTGRGSLGKKGDAMTGQLGSLLLFAPKYLISRFSFAFGVPLVQGAVTSRRALRMAAEEYLRIAAGMAAVYALAAIYQAGTEDDDEDWMASADPRSSDFGKVRFGDVYIDPMAGLAQVYTFASRVATATTVVEGEERSLGPDRRYGERGVNQVIWDFLRSKESPLVGTVLDLATRESYGGMPLTADGLVVDATVPLAFRDVVNVAEARGAEGLGLWALSLFGMGMQYRDLDHWEEVKQARKEYAEEKGR